MILTWSPRRNARALGNSTNPLTSRLRIGHNPIGNMRWTSPTHDQTHDAWGVLRLRPLQLNRYERIARK